jgi:vitamin B12 transporter
MALDEFSPGMKKKITQLYLIRRHKIFYALSLLVQMCFLQTTHAQTDTTKKLKEVNVNAKTPLKPQAIVPSQQLSATDFKRFGALNVADALVGFAGVNLKDYGGIGGLKTISVRSLGPNHTGILYDGVQLNDAQNGQIDLGKFNLNNVNSITLYNGQSPNIVQPARSFASSSLLAITTTRPQLTIAKPYQITASLNGGSFGLINPYLQWQQRVSKQWSFVINGNYTGANGRYKFKADGDGADTLATRTNADIKAYQTDGALYWAKSDSNKFKLQYNYYNSDRGLPGAVIPYVNNSLQRLQDHNLLVQSGYEYVAKSSFHLLINSKFSQDYQHYLNPSFYNSSGNINEHYTQHEFYQSASAGYHILTQWEISYSVDAAVTNLQSDVYQYAFPTRFTLLNAVATHIAAGKWHFLGNVLQTYITESVKSGTAANAKSIWSPTLMATFQPFQNSGLVFRAFYKDIFRNPTFSEQYYYAIVPRVLRPEYAKQYNLGATYQKNLDGFWHDIALTADAYYNNVKDKIIYLPTRDPSIPSVTNLGKVDIKGLDVTARASFIPVIGWLGSINLSYTYQNAVDVTNPADKYYLKQIANTPKNLLNVNAGINHHQMGLYYNYLWSSSRYSESDNVPEYYLNGYHINSATFTYTFLNHKSPVTASAELNNIFNRNYVIVKNYPMPGRSIRLSIQITI